MTTLSRAEIDLFLAAPLLARIATVRPDGRPHIAPMWFWWDGTSMYMETPPDSVKANNLRSNPFCAITVDITEGGLRFKSVILEGRAELLDDPVYARDMARRVYTKYLGEEGVRSPTPASMISNPHVIIKLTPSRILTYDGTRIGLAPIP